MSWREYTVEEDDVQRDRGTFLERAVGWVLTYPVRAMITMFVVVVLLTLWGL